LNGVKGGACSGQPGAHCPGKPFEGKDRAVLCGFNGHHAAELCFSVQQDHTGAALLHAAAIFRAIQFQLIAQNIQQRRSRIGLYGMFFTVDAEIDRCRHNDFV